MNRTLATILLIAVGIYCLPGLIALAATVFAIVLGVAGALIGVVISLVVTLLPLVIVGYLIWWLVRDNRRSRQY
jgi:hypothetical protein